MQSHTPGDAMALHRSLHFASWIAAAALGLSIAGSAALAERSLGNLHEGEEPTPTADGARRFLDAAQAARARGQCPRAKFTVVVKKGDPLFQHASAAARRDGLLRLLGDRARYFAFELDWEGKAHEVKVDYDVARDQESPKLEVVWDPPSGTKVRAGTRIKATATARDDWNLWQRGIRRIDLNVLPESSNQSFGFHEWPPHPVTCENTPPARTLEGVYVVPSPAPPVVRLRVRAVDHAGNQSADVHIAEYPTAGEQELIPSSDGSCSHRADQPNRFRLALVGSYSERGALSVSIRDIAESKLVVRVLCDGTPPQQYEMSIRTYLHPALLGPLGWLGEGELAADGSRRYRLPANAGDANGTLTLRRVR